jgi:phage terminase Nu1 subunit (DNA packaging protein)
MPHISTDVLAKALDVTPRRVRQLAQEGVFPRQAHGKWDLAKCLLAYVRHVQKELRGRNGSGENGAEIPGLTAERERRLRVQRERDEIRLAKERGALIPVETYRRELTEAFSTVRERLLGLKRLAPDLEGLPRAMIEIRLDAAVRDVLASLADGLPAPSRQPRKPAQPPGSAETRVSVPGAASDPESERVGGPQPLPPQGN